MNIFGKTLNEIKNIVTELKLPTYTAQQIVKWVYSKNTHDFELMTDISKQNRKLLKENLEINCLKPIEVQTSIDGTKKYLFKTHKGFFIESVVIPSDDRTTVCVSTQAGCAWGCKFCMTAQQGLQGNLNAGEILSQIVGIPEHNEVNRIVFMGMGEPLSNFEEVLKSIEILTSEYGYNLSKNKITLSTVGILPEFEKLIVKNPCRIAISLHTPFSEERKNWMPVEKHTPINEIIKIIRESKIYKKQRISFEYIMFKDKNDTSKHAKEIVKILNGINCRINLINYHETNNEEFLPETEEKMIEFQKKLKEKGIFTTIRKSRGKDIFAACGMLSTLRLKESKY